MPLQSYLPPVLSPALFCSPCQPDCMPFAYAQVYMCSLHAFADFQEQPKPRKRIPRIGAVLSQGPQSSPNPMSRLTFLPGISRPMWAEHLQVRAPNAHGLGPDTAPMKQFPENVPGPSFQPGEKHSSGCLGNGPGWPFQRLTLPCTSTISHKCQRGPASLFIAFPNPKTLR